MPPHKTSEKRHCGEEFYGNGRPGVNGFGIIYHQAGASIQSNFFSPCFKCFLLQIMSKKLCRLFLSKTRKYPLIVVSLAVLLLIVLQPAIAQPGQPKISDTLKLPAIDTVLPNIVIKVALYTATIDHTDFLIRRKLNLTPISMNLPEIETKVKNFKMRLEKYGSHMNLRSLNSGVIILQEISKDLAFYQNILNNYSNELTQSNAAVKKILQDPILKQQLPDTILMEQLEDIDVEGAALDSLQIRILSKVNLLRNRVSINLLQATDIISDMKYLTMSLKLGMWSGEEAPLFSINPGNYPNGLAEITSTALFRSWKIIVIYLSDKLDILVLCVLIIIGIYLWILRNMRRIKKMSGRETILAQMHFLPRSILIGCLMVFFTFLPFFFANPTMSFLHSCEVLRLAMLIYLIYPFLSKTSKLLWMGVCLLWLYYALDDILLEAAFGERWGLFFAGILLACICIKIIFDNKPVFKTLPESPVTKALAIFALALAVFSVIFDLTGRLSLAKIAGVTAIQSIVVGVGMKVFSTIVIDAAYLQWETYQVSRFSDFINYNALRYRIQRALWMLSFGAWALTLIHNLTLYDALLHGLDVFFNTTRTIGSMVFSFKSVAVFILIIWLSTVISGLINFFFGNKKTAAPDKKSKLGSMMLLIRLAVWTLGFSIAVAAAGIPLDKLSIMIGALGVGIGFGLQNIVNNLVSGIILAFERPIQVGDLIELGDKKGTVKEIGVRSSKIDNNAGGEIIVPNGDLLSQHLINWTMHDRNKQVELIIGIPHKTNINEVSHIIKNALLKSNSIMATPPSTVSVQQFTERSIQLKINFWVHDLLESSTATSNAMMNIYDDLAAADISLAYPPTPVV